MADSGGLRVDSVVNAHAGAAQLLPSLPAAPAASDAPPSQPGATPPAPEGDTADVPAHALFFEVSCHTGLLHAFLQNGDAFQHLGSARLPFASRKADFPFSLPAVRSAAVTFLAVWDTLSVVERHELWHAAKPLRLPLDSALQAALAARKLALSTIRVAKPEDVVPAPPADWKSKKYVFLQQAGRVRQPFELYISADDEWLCLACSDKPARVQHPHGGGADPRVTSKLDLCCSIACHDQCVRCVAACVQRLTRCCATGWGFRRAALSRASRCSSKSAASARSATLTARTSEAGCCWAAKARSFRWRCSATSWYKSTLASRSTSC